MLKTLLDCFLQALGTVCACPCKLDKAKGEQSRTIIRKIEAFLIFTAPILKLNPADLSCEFLNCLNTLNKFAQITLCVFLRGLRMQSIRLFCKNGVFVEVNGKYYVSENKLKEV